MLMKLGHAVLDHNITAVWNLNIRRPRPTTRPDPQGTLVIQYTMPTISNFNDNDVKSLQP